MKSSPRGEASAARDCRQRCHSQLVRRRRYRLWGLVVGVCALVWVVVRAGSKPSRLSYPCQQSALVVAFTNLLGPLLALLIAARVGLLRCLRSTGGKLIGGACGTLFVAIWTFASFETLPPLTRIAPPTDHFPDVYFVRHARNPTPTTLGGIDDLVTLMGVEGFKLHRSVNHAITAGPNGLIETDSVVLLKVNAQWGDRGGTNTDVVRGVIRNIVDHPDGFDGEIVVVDNGQGFGSLSRTNNNAEDTTQSVEDVVADFVAEGWRVSAHLWDSIREIPADEYINGDLRDGYVVASSLDVQTSVRVSYPKFQTSYGTYVSFKRGIWEPLFALYDSNRLVVINMPVLKTHAIYAVTASVKNFMGVVTRRLGTDSHNGVGRGAMGSILADVRMPDLTILDAVWILARPGRGPSAWYEEASFRNQLVAGTDPVALDRWAVKNVLLPQIIENGYGESSWRATQDPDNPAGVFRQYLDRSMNEMLLGAIRTTNDTDSVKLHVWSGDTDLDGDLDLADFAKFASCATGPDIATDALCETFDYNADSRSDLLDIAAFQNIFTASFDN